MPSPKDADDSQKNEPATYEPPMIKGKVVITAMLLVGLLMSGFAWWARYSSGRRVLDVLGQEAVIAIRTGEKVELLRTSSDVDASQDVAVQENAIQFSPDVGTEPSTFYVLSATEITDVPGLIHARHHLVHEQGYVWDSQASGEPETNARLPSDQPASWNVALRFTSSAKPTTLLLDLSQQRGYFVERRRAVTLRPILSDALQTFIDGVDVPDGNVNVQPATSVDIQ